MAHNPFPSSLRHECEKACEILEAFLNPSIPNSTSTRILQNAQGLAIFSTVKGAFMGSVRFGSGILVARLDDGSWSAPSAIVVGGLGFGGQVGVEFTNFIFVLPRKSSVRTFAQRGSLTLTANISLALGPAGRSGEVGVGASLHGLGALWAMSKTNGFFGGLSVELATFIEHGSSNRKLYQKKLTAAQLLNGEIKPPDDAKMLMECLAHKAFYSSQHRIPDPELPSDPSTARALELPSGAENQPPAQLPTQGALLVELPGESLSPPLEERETSAREARNHG